MMMFRDFFKASVLVRLLVLGLLLALLASCGGSGGAASNPPPPPPPPPPGGGGGGGGNASPSTVAIIIFENQRYENVIGNSAMPFLNGLVPQGGLATQYFANTHPSIGNYFMLTTGAIESNNDAFAGTVSDDNIVRQLAAATKTWKGYFQSIPSAGYLGSDRYPYIRHHNPFSFFTDLQSNAAQAANIMPLDQLAADESAGSFPNFMFIVPDNEHNAHDCPGGPSSTCTLTDRLAAVDAFLAAQVPGLLNNATFKQNGVLVIVFDEADAADLRNVGGHVPAIILGATVKVGFQSTTMYQHQNLLRQISDMLKITAPGAASTATGMSEFFQ
jgi:phosphatidylinositol-3-phosphatase